MDRILLYGGSFDPIHNGHLIVARAVRERLGDVTVMLLPAPHPPHKPNATLASVDDRLEMCRLAVQGEEGFIVSDWEARRAGPSYTLHTVRHFRQEFGDDAWLGWLIGADTLNELHTWYEVGELCEACTIVTAARPGFVPNLERLRGLVSPRGVAEVERHVLETPKIEISASEIRARRRAGCSVRFLTPDAVVAYIEQHRLYA